MQPRAEFLQDAISEAPKTDAVKFLITPRDVGSEAVRPGHMAELEERYQVLLLSAKLTLNRLRQSGARVGAETEYALAMAIKMAEEQ